MWCNKQSRTRVFERAYISLGMKIVSGLIDVALKVGVEQDVTQVSFLSYHLPIFFQR